MTAAGIQVDKINAGAVYQQQLAEGQTDTDGDVSPETSAKNG